MATFFHQLLKTAGRTFRLRRVQVGFMGNMQPRSMQPSSAQPRSMQPSVKCVSLEGNVGCGKSSTLGVLKQKGYTVVPEPIEKWGATLDLFYSNPQKYCYVFQTRVLAELVTMREKILNAPRPHKGDVIFFERSQMGAKVFLEVAVDNGDMHRAEHETYLRLEAMMLQARPAVASANVHVLIDTPPDHCCERIVQRERQAEQDGPLMSTAAQRRRYIQQIHDKHEEVFEAVDVIRVDGTMQPENVAEAVLDALCLNVQAADNN